MSTWTHVNAHFRFDVFRVNGSDYNNVSDIEAHLGPIKTFKDILLGNKNYVRYYREDCKLPTGSEGSLRYNVYLDKKGNRQYVNIAFFGDLRDYDSVESILRYFTEFLNDKDVYVSLRSGILNVTSIGGIQTFLAKDLRDFGKSEEISYFFEELIDPNPI